MNEIIRPANAGHAPTTFAGGSGPMRLFFAGFTEHQRLLNRMRDEKVAERINGLSLLEFETEEAARALVPRAEAQLRELEPQTVIEGNVKLLRTALETPADELNLRCALAFLVAALPTGGNISTATFIDGVLWANEEERVSINVFSVGIQRLLIRTKFVPAPSEMFAECSIHKGEIHEALRVWRHASRVHGHAANVLNSAEEWDLLDELAPATSDDDDIPF